MSCIETRGKTNYKIKADTNRAGEQSKELAKKKKKNETVLNVKRPQSLEAGLSLFYPLLFKRTPSEAPKNYNVPSKSLCNPNICNVGSVLSLLIVLEGNALKWQRL